DTNSKFLPLRELEALACALLAVLFAFFGARVTSYHALALKLLAQFGIEFHERAGDAEAYRVGLSRDATATHIREYVKRGRALGGDQRRIKDDALRGRHKVFIERLAVDIEFAAA